ncbi:MAG: hypothetical protein ACFWTN_10425 [Clostridium sp.]|jgi:hypothetical protein
MRLESFFIQLLQLCKKQIVTSTIFEIYKKHSPITTT